MISRKKLTDNGDALADYLMATELKKTDYYHDMDQPMRWGGKACEELGLVGKVKREQMLLLFAGFHPETGEALVQNAGAKPKTVMKTKRDGTEYETKVGGRVSGWDFTFSANKYASTLAAVGGDEAEKDVWDAHKHSVDKVMKKIFQECAETRKGHAGKDYLKASLIWSEHDHTSSRAGDPDVHTHVIIYNLAKGSDGSWGALETKELMAVRHAADMVYQNEMACFLRERGYGISQYEEVEKGEQVKRWGITGISKELCDAFSSRRKEIVAYMEAHGVYSQTACLTTRNDKAELSYEELKANWKAVAEELGMSGDLSRVKDNAEDKRLPSHSNEEISKRLHKNEAIVREHEVMKHISQENIGFMRYEDILRAVEDFKKDAELLPVAPKAIHEEDRGRTLSREYTEQRYQAKWLQDHERNILEGALQRQGEKNLKLKSKTVDKAIDNYEKRKGFSLTEEQKEFIEYTTTKTQGVCVLRGFAGTGKTTTSEVTKDAFEAEGYELFGVCINNAAALKLKAESGMESRSVAMTLHMLDKQKLTLTNKHVMVIDEAGMLDTSSTSRLLEHARIGGAKVIMQGDDNQLQPIQAGSGFLLAEQVLGSAKLTEIRRQKTNELRELAESYYIGSDDELKSRREVQEKGQAILGKLEENKVISEHDTVKEAKDQLIADYFKSKKEPDEKLILAHTKSDVRELTNTIRQTLKETNKLSQEDFAMKCYVNKEHVMEQFAQGDRVRFRARDDSLGVVNGTEGVIQQIGISEWDGGVQLAVRVEDRVVKFSQYEYSALSHNYAMTVHAAQGQGKDSVFHLYNAGMSDNQSMLVSMTRAKENYTIYGEREELEGLANRLGMDRKKENALSPQLAQRPAQELHR